MNDRTSMTHEEWLSEAAKRFGSDPLKWRFVCPVCGYVASVADWKAVGARVGEVAFSCIGRHRENARDAFAGKGAGPCNYAGGGLFRLNPVNVVMDDGRVVETFAFADASV